ncbi:MAG: FMN-binding glutamate synthase family protein, partial [Candidatus Thiodiazotropha sp. (ex Lucinoma borealis)]|nr:FMN-binding glutamate synthase family protein [Candidatus Thiodiazotropha sp. (ex Lucinoma borealis)]
MQTFLIGTLEVFSFILILLLGGLLIAVIVTYIYDVTQTKTAIRRNYPVIGHFRYFFEHLGEFFRQYFFAMDREELPFNRAQRAWVYRAGKDLPNTVAFGSTRDIRRPGSILFVNCPFPTLGEDAVPPGYITIGESCRYPYTTDSLFNISGMSYGALSKPAVLALSMGAQKAGCWINTGEGGVSPYHLEGGAAIAFQIGTAKNGVRDMAGNLSDEKLQEVSSLPQVKMFEIKLSQGAKPGKGGILPGKKVTREIAAIRGIAVGEDAISPNRHTDVRCNNDLMDMIKRVRDVTGKPVGFKTVIGGPQWLDGLFADINKRGLDYAPDFITLDGSDGGTGAAPMPLIDAVGLSLRESLYVLVDKLNA